MKKKPLIPRLSGKLGALSVAAGAAALGAASTSEAALNVFDHRAAPLYPIVDYWTFDQTLMVMNVKTGDFQYVVDDLAGTVSRYDQDGFVDNSMIPGSELTNDTVWFSHRDANVDIGKGNDIADVVTFETPTGGAGGTLDTAATNFIWSPERNDPAAATHDMYWADQDGTALPLPVDGPATVQVDGGLLYNDSSPTGYTGVMTHGYGGKGHGSGTRWYVEGPDGWSVTVPFKLEEADGTHYGWVAFRHDADRNRIRSVYGWAYETTAGVPADLTWISTVLTFEPGDVNEDGFINGEDIDLMGEYIRTGFAPNAANYDLSADGMTGGTDGDIDLDDLDYLVRYLVETSAVDGSGDPIFGTQYGDFNLDGEIELGDLTRLGTYYGVGSTWAQGNANPHLDTDIELGDLTILGTYYGASNGGVDAIPEPMTMSLLALGGSAVIRKRRK